MIREMKWVPAMYSVALYKPDNDNDAIKNVVWIPQIRKEAERSQL